MGKRISLYFEPYAWERMNRCLALLLLSGKPLYDLPSMNDLIEGMVVHVSSLYSTATVGEKDLLPYIERGLSAFSKNTLTNASYDKGRIAFNVTSRTETSIKTMRKTSREFLKLKIGDDFLKEVSDPILIRACVYYEIAEKSSDFYVNLYFSFLFGLRPYAISFDHLKFKHEINFLNVDEKNNLRKISWDEGIIKNIFEMLTTVDESSYYTIENSPPMPYLDPGSVENPAFRSRGFDFNYLAAFIGFIFFRRSIENDLTIPAVTVEFVIEKAEIKYYSDCLKEIGKISNEYNQMKIDDEPLTSALDAEDESVDKSSGA